MHDLNIGDIVTFKFNRLDHHGIIRKIRKNTADVFIEDIYETKKLSLDKLTYVEPIILSEEQVRKLCRYESKWSELISGHPDYVPVYFEQPYTITLQDILIAIDNIKRSKDGKKTVKTEWYDNLYEYMFDYDNTITFEEAPSEIEMLEYLPNRSDYLYDLFNEKLDEILSDRQELIIEKITELSSQMMSIIENEQKPVLERYYTDADKEYYLTKLNNDDRLKTASELELKVYRKFTDDLIQKDNITALKCKGYGCYGGDPAYECDWNTSLACITRLYELTGKPVYANTLGYIYYYGRCWNGQPKYNEAFKYFSIGAAGFYYESRYKLADMFVHGYGVQKSTEIAQTIVSELYDQNLPYILDGKFNCKFADIALRLGSYAERGYSKTADDYDAYKYYLQADFAIKQRLQFNHYGDTSVANSIKERLTSILESGKIEKPKKSTYFSYLNLLKLLYHHLKNYRKLQLDFKSINDDDFKLIIRIVPFGKEKYPPKLFITDTDTGFCGMLEALTIRVKKGKLLVPKTSDLSLYFDNIVPAHDSSEKNIGVSFFLGDKEQAVVYGKLKFTPPEKALGKKYRFASVYFSPGGKHYDYLLDIENVKVGDTVYVITDFGETPVTVANIIEKSETELALPIGKYKKIIKV